MGGVLIVLTVMELVSMFWYWDIEEAGKRHRGNVEQADFSRWSRNTGAYIQLCRTCLTRITWFVRN